MRRSVCSRVVALVGLVFVLSGCGTLQPAEPLPKSLPVAVGLLGLLVLVGWGAWRVCAPLRRVRRHRPVRARRVLSLAVLAGGGWLTGFGVLLAVLGAGVVGVGFRHPRTDTMSWGDYVGLTVVIGCVSVVLSVLLVHLVLGLWRSQRGAWLVGVLFSAASAVGFGVGVAVEMAASLGGSSSQPVDSAGWPFVVAVGVFGWLLAPPPAQPAQRLAGEVAGEPLAVD